MAQEYWNLHNWIACQHARQVWLKYPVPKTENKLRANAKHLVVILSPPIFRTKTLRYHIIRHTTAISIPSYCAHWWIFVVPHWTGRKVSTPWWTRPWMKRWRRQRNSKKWSSKEGHLGHNKGLQRGWRSCFLVNDGWCWKDRNNDIYCWYHVDVHGDVADDGDGDVDVDRDDDGDVDDDGDGDNDCNAKDRDDDGNGSVMMMVSMMVSMNHELSKLFCFWYWYRLNHICWQQNWAEDWNPNCWVEHMRHKSMRSEANSFNESDRSMVLSTIPFSNQRSWDGSPRKQGWTLVNIICVICIILELYPIPVGTTPPRTNWWYLSTFTIRCIYLIWSDSVIDDGSWDDRPSRSRGTNSVTMPRIVMSCNTEHVVPMYLQPFYALYRQLVTTSLCSWRSKVNHTPPPFPL